MPAPPPSSFSYEGNPNNNIAGNNNGIKDNSDPNTSVRRFSEQSILQAQNQVQQAGNSNSNGANPYLVAHFLSAMNSSIETNTADKMNNGSNQTNHLPLPSNSISNIASNNVKVNVNGMVNNGNPSANASNSGNHSVVNFPMQVPNLFRHVPYDAATAALLMNPQAAAHAAVAAQAAVASVAQQFVSSQQSQQTQQPQQQSHQQPKGPQATVSVPGTNQGNDMNPLSSTQSQNVTLNVPANSFGSNNLNTSSLSLQTNSNVSTVTAAPPISKPRSPISSTESNGNVSVNSNNQIGVNQALAVLSSAGLLNNSNINQATAQAVAAAAVASGMKIPSGQTHGRNQHAAATHPHPRAPHNHTHTHNRNQNHRHTQHTQHTQQSHIANVGVRTNNTTKNKNPALNSVPSSIRAMPPPSKSPIGIQSMMTTLPTLRPPGTKKPLLGVTGTVGNPLENMRNWSLQELETHVRLLQERSQPVPQPLALLLADARRKEEKRTAKRVANRKSACTSRARKKALVEEMTRTNAKLKRQALILSLLPDLVVAITVNGEITFCSAQVERVLRHSVNDLIGSNLMDILLPVSKEALRHLINVLVTAEANELNSQNIRNKQDNGGSSSSSSSSNDAAIVSEQSFPLSVVKVMGPEKNSSSGSSTNNNNCSSSAAEKGKNSSSLTNSSLGNSSSQSGSDEDRIAGKKVPSNGTSSTKTHDPPSPPQRGNICDETSSAEAKLRASEALNRNVRHHKDQLCKDKLERSTKHKDDVTGASVTANNADARLSSLQHNPKNGKSNATSNDKKGEGKKDPIVYENLEVQSSSSASSDSLLSGVEEKPSAKTNNEQTQQRARSTNENESDDSGFRAGSESFPSREDSGSSADDSSTNQRNGRRPKPLAPTCNICLIRDDLTTIWCEVTSSIRTRSLNDEVVESSLLGATSKHVVSATSSTNATTAAENKADSSTQEDTVKELLLCLRPIREGEEKVTEEFKFKPKTAQSGETISSDKQTAKKITSPADSDKKPLVSANSTASSSPAHANGNIPQTKRPMKKRPFSDMNATRNASGGIKRNGNHSQSIVPDVPSATEQSVVESLILMSHKQNRNDN